METELSFMHCGCLAVLRTITENSLKKTQNHAKKFQSRVKNRYDARDFFDAPINIGAIIPANTLINLGKQYGV
jgi:hypothetical protein